MAALFCLLVTGAFGQFQPYPTGMNIPTNAAQLYYNTNFHYQARPKPAWMANPGGSVSNYSFSLPGWTNTLVGDKFIAWRVTVAQALPMGQTSKYFWSNNWSVSNWPASAPLYWTANAVVYNPTNGFRLDPALAIQTVNGASNSYSSVNGTWSIIGPHQTNKLTVASGVWTVTGWGKMNQTNTIWSGLDSSALTNNVASFAGTNGPWTWTDPTINDRWRFYAIITTH